jgi:hypothetical protein
LSCINRTNFEQSNPDKIDLDCNSYSIVFIVQESFMLVINNSAILLAAKFNIIELSKFKIEKWRYSKLKEANDVGKISEINVYRQ